MKLKMKLAEENGSIHQNGYDAYLAGFDAAKEMCAKLCEKCGELGGNSTMTEWDKNALGFRQIGENEIVNVSATSVQESGTVEVEDKKYVAME